VSSLPHLFSPLELGPVTLRNRIVSTAHQTTLVHDHLPGDEFVAYHETRARGGVGLIVLEATAVHPSALLTPHTLGGYIPELADGYRRVAHAVQPFGTRLFVQLLHGGREQIASAPRPAALAPSAVPSPRFRVEPRAMRATEIEEIVDGYARSAEIAAAGGVDGLEISAAHRYLVEQFLDPELNVRDDEWSDGRRFFREVVHAVRGVAPGLCLGVRLSADSERLGVFAELVRSSDIDYVSLALGDSSTYRGSVGIVPPTPIDENTISAYARSFDVGLPRIVTSRIVDPVAADELIAGGEAEAVGMTRALIADPDLPRKASEGRVDRILACIGCNACIAHYHAGTPIACAVNPRTGRESWFRPSTRAGARRRIVVVGGGPAGLAAAIESGLAGHDVILLERAARLGGQIVLAGAAPGSAGLARSFLATAERQLALAAVRTQLNTEATETDVLALHPDAVVVATGARPFRDHRVSAEGIDVLQAWDVLGGEVPSGRTAVVTDWGGDPSGLDAAELLAGAGNYVTLAVASVAVGEGTHQYRRNLYLQRLYRAEVTIVSHLELVDARDGIVRLRNVFAAERTETFEADLLVLAQGRVPEDSLGAELASTGIPVAEAGDCLSPRSLEEAVLEGTLAAQRAGAPAMIGARA
jgi:2,4-dienoyl-CoA reductase-like NADH-dependent reductase (Old Yellow Enzyme family)/thioredoxin reductase